MRGNGGTDPLDPRIGALQEILDLGRRTMVQQRAEDHPGTDILLTTSAIKPAFLEVTGLGGWLTVLMSLPSCIPPEQLEKTAHLLRADPNAVPAQAATA